MRTKLRKLSTEQPFDGYFEQVYSDYFQPLYLYARSLVKSDDIAKGVVSDVFFNLWKSNSDLKNIKEIKSYLFRAVKNQVVRTLSHDPRNFDSIDTENYVKQIEQISPEEILLEKELIEIIDKAVQELPDQCRLIFDMAKNKQMSYKEIAAELEISQSTIKTQVARAISVIKQKIEIYYDNTSSQSWKSFEIGGAISLVFFLLNQSDLLGKV
ncbi:RNA polymerase sigma-70 factor [Reichenbachiella ulvae]|uniref:RNA polymerase sigma-70 factor n=1 Tax=Reichenbachiella ulvae TaxID=2980104 RepID=A0ABT3CUU6_9BACT|nr:RNA polymerase sigma-70 factor [Reichenbachiella ulvae]MCV9387407.1 RNA polymerase sigma-70 factor [Reichenbachiella ulvae]